MTTHLIRPPLLVDDGIEQDRVVRGPHGATLGVVDDVVEQFPAVEVLDAQREALGARRVGAVGQQTGVVGHGERPAPEIPDAGGERRFVEDDVRRAGRALLRAGVLRRPTRPYAVLRTFGESPLVVERAVLDRNVCVIRLLARLDFLVYRLDQFAARSHRRLEVGVLGLQIGDHVLVVDRWKAVVLQPAIGVLHGQAVEGVGRRSRFGHGRRRRVCHVGYLSHMVRGIDRISRPRRMARAASATVHSGGRPRRARWRRTGAARVRSPSARTATSPGSAGCSAGPSG